MLARLLIFVVLIAIGLPIFFFLQVPALHYSVIVFFSFSAAWFFARIAKPPKIPKAEFEKLDSKYSKHVFFVDAVSIVIVLSASVVLYFFLAFLKNIFYSQAAFDSVFVSNPQGLLFLAGFLLSLSLSGWVVHAAVKNFFGADYWNYYYNRPGVGFDTKKIYKVISVCLLLLSGPALVLGFDDYTVVTGSGIVLNDWARLGPKQVAWQDVSKIELVWDASTGKDFYVVSFYDGQKWNMSNENWAVGAKPVVDFISQKSGTDIS